MADYDIFELGNVVLQSGLTLRNAQLAYKTYDTLTAAKITPSSTRIVAGNMRRTSLCLARYGA